MSAEPEPPAADIVRHLEAGDGRAQALARWAVAAGRQAEQSFDHRRACEYYELARVQLERVADGEEKRGLALDAYTGLGTVQPRTGQSKDALVSL